MAEQATWQALERILEEHFDREPDATPLEEDPNATLEELGVGNDPLGPTHLLDFLHQIEQTFRISFPREELPTTTDAQRLSITDVADAIEKKLQRAS